MSILPREIEQPGQQLAAETAAAATWNDGDRQLGDLLADEAEPGRVGGEEPVPRGPDRACLPRDEPGVACSPQLFT